MCFNYDNILFVIGGIDGYVCVWKVFSLEKVLEFKVYEGEIEDLVLGFDGKLVIVGWDFKVFVW